jgi:DNA-binding response OmpR family regulator
MHAGRCLVAEDNQHRIVYIEDDQDMIDLVTTVLARDNFEVIGVSEGREGIEKVRQIRPSVILLDLMLPDISGWVVYQSLKQEPDLSDIPVIVVTARGAPIDKVLGEHIAKVQAYIVKPFGTQDLRSSVKRVLGIA